MTHTVSTLTSGTIYSFKFRAKNNVGHSEFSVARRFAASAPPVKPDMPTKNMGKSTQKSIFVEWAESLPSAAPILGYKLYMSAGTSEYEVIYSSLENPLVRQFDVQNLDTGVLYQFKVAAINFNGDSEMSDALTKYSCLLPGTPEVPYRVSGTRTELTLRWSVPADDGGCPLTGFNLYRDDGSQ
jgi:hypothetical protein